MQAKVEVFFSSYIHVWLKLLTNTALICIYIAYILRKDLPPKSLPVIGKYFR